VQIADVLIDPGQGDRRSLPAGPIASAEPRLLWRKFYREFIAGIGGWIGFHRGKNDVRILGMRRGFKAYKGLKRL